MRPAHCRRASTAVLVFILFVLGGVLSLAGSPIAIAAQPVIDYPVEGSTVSGNEFTASGTSTEPFDITIRMNQSSADICVIPAQAGTWTWECSIAGLSSGPQTLRLIQNGLERSVSFTLTGTELVVDFPVDGGVVYGSLNEARGTADAGDSIAVEIDGEMWCWGGPPSEPGDEWSCGGSSLAAGIHTFAVFQGGVAWSGSFEIVGTLPAPTIDSVGGLIELDAEAVTGGLTITGSGTYYSEEPVTVTVDLFEAPFVAGDPSVQFCATTPASDGRWAEPVKCFV